MTKRLWEVEHSYYCEPNNYYARGDQQPGDEFDCWEDFMSEYKETDMDHNLLFRWDWKEEDFQDDNEMADEIFEQEPDKGQISDNEPSAYFYVFWMCQRKGLYRSSRVTVCRDDEPAVREFLQPFYDHLKKLWEPIV